MPLFYFSAAQKQFISFLLCSSFFAGTLSIPATASTPTESQSLTNSHFGDNWLARPLIDTTLPPKVVQPPKPQISQAMLDAKLAPYEGFMKAIEKSLAIIVPAGSGRVARLNAIQKIVFDEQVYHGDAGQLIARLQKVFPKEAAATLKPFNQQGIQTANRPQQGPQILSSAPLPDGVKMRQQQLTRREQARLEKAQQKAIKQSQSDDVFANDPFFKDDNSSTLSSSSGGSKAKAALGGLAGVAMLAGGMAGSYYMNRNIKAPSYGTTAPVYGYPNYPVTNNPYTPYATNYGQYYQQPQYPINYGYGAPVMINQQKGIGGILNQVLGNNGYGYNYPPGYSPYNTVIQGYNPGVQTYTSNGVTYFNNLP